MIFFFIVDHTRVILEEVEAGNTDYINANRISYVSSDGSDDHHSANRKEYIATQGCLQNTRTDFWQMVWQEKTRVIGKVFFLICTTLCTMLQKLSRCEVKA